MTKTAYIIGTADTKGAELRYVRDLIAATGAQTRLVDVGTKGGGAPVDESASLVASYHPDGPSAVFSDDRGQAVAEMSRALTAFVLAQDDIAGVIGLGGSGGSSIIAPALQALPIGIPKVLVSTLASGDVSAYVGASDVNMFHPVTDVSGLNRVSRKLLANAAHALAGMIKFESPHVSSGQPALVLSMFGVTTPAVQAATHGLGSTFDCLVFPATSSGGRSMELLVDQGDIAGSLDLTTTDVCDLLVGGVLPASEDRFGAIARSGVPYVGSCGALDMVNFWAPHSIPTKFQGRTFYNHNAEVTLMRTTPSECATIGAWIGNKLNACEGPIRFLLPLRGVSALDTPDGPFHDPEASEALFGALRETVDQTADRLIVELDHHINEPEFAEAAVSHFQEIYEEEQA